MIPLYLFVKQEIRKTIMSAMWVRRSFAQVQPNLWKIFFLLSCISIPNLKHKKHVLLTLENRVLIEDGTAQN